MNIYCDLVFHVSFSCLCNIILLSTGACVCMFTPVHLERERERERSAKQNFHDLFSAD